MFGGDVFVLEILRFLESALENLVYGVAHVLLAEALHFGKARDGALDFLRRALRDESQV